MTKRNKPVQATRDRVPDGQVWQHTMLRDRLSLISTAVTVAMMFFGFAWVAPSLRELETPYGIAVGAAGMVASLGVYRLLATGLLWLFGKSLFLRKRILGMEFLEGTWVGHYTHGAEHRFTIEFIDQSSGATVVRGREFDSAGKTRASWSSDTVSIDTVRMQLVYAYTCKVFEAKHVQEGLGVFAIVCEVSGKPANKLDGYSVDLVDGDRDPNTEHKIRDIAVGDDEALEQARVLFKVSK